MTNIPEWLPELVLLAKYGGGWNRYTEAVYLFFKEDFVDSKPSFRGKRLGLKRHPLEQGKEATFWHLVSEGSIEKDRLPDLRRCERIRWPRPIIEHVDDNEVAIKVWENQRKDEKRILLWFEEAEYLVILADRGKYLLPWTAYLVDREHTKRKLQKEHEDYWDKKS